MWSHVRSALRAIFPGLLILRLADRQKPAMDLLYFFVRRMNMTLQRSKEILDAMETDYQSHGRLDVQTCMLNYFLPATDAIDYHNESGKTVTYADDEEPSDSEAEFASEEEEEDDEVPIDEELSDDEQEQGPKQAAEEEEEEEIPTLGGDVLIFWNRRKPKLISDISISGWMVSPRPEVKADCYQHHTGLHRDAVERLLKKWFMVSVSILSCFVFCSFFATNVVTSCC